MSPRNLPHRHRRSHAHADAVQALIDAVRHDGRPLCQIVASAGISHRWSDLVWNGDPLGPRARAALLAQLDGIDAETFGAACDALERSSAALDALDHPAPRLRAAG